METNTIVHDRDRYSSRLAKINWEYLTFWLVYFATIFGLGYTLL
jgi:hypothetical protein